MDRSVTLSRKPIQPNRDGEGGCYPRVRGEKLWRFGGKGGGPSTEGLWRVAGRCFGGYGEMVTVAVERGRMRIARRAPVARRGTEPDGSVKTRRIGRGAGSTSVESVTQRPVVVVEGSRVVVGRGGSPALVGLGTSVPGLGSVDVGWLLCAPRRWSFAAVSWTVAGR